MDKKLGAGIIKNKKDAYRRAKITSIVLAVLGFFACAGLMIGSVFVCLKGVKSLIKYMETDDYKNTITAEIDQINNDFDDGKIDSTARDTRMERSQDMIHARELLKKSDYQEWKEDVSKHDNISIGMGAAACVAVLGSAMSAIAAEKYHKKEKKEELLPEDEENA